MVRKKFVKTCAFACIGTTTLSALLHSCASTNYFARVIIGDNRIIIKKTEFVKIESDKSIQRKFILVKPDNLNFPICVYKIEEENYSALLMECTHRGCELRPHEGYLTCPCHGSEFTNMGVVQNPPAEENLKVFKTTTDHENIYIQL